MTVLAKGGSSPIGDVVLLFGVGIVVLISGVRTLLDARKGKGEALNRARESVEFSHRKERENIVLSWVLGASGLIGGFAAISGGVFLWIQ